MNQSRVLILVTLAFAIHAVEEYAAGFVTTDPTVLWLASILSVSPLIAWSLVEVIVFAFLGVLYGFRSAKTLWVILLLFMLAQLYHLFFAIYAHSYAGAYSSILFLPLLWLTYRVSPLRRQERTTAL